MRWTLTAIVTAICSTLICPLVSPQVCRAQALADHIPADALVYAGWKGLDPQDAAYQQSHLKAVLDASELPRLISQSIPLLLEHVAQQNPRLGQPVQMMNNLRGILADYWQHPAALYIAAPSPNAYPAPRFALLCDAGPDAAAMADHITTLLAATRLPIRCTVNDTLVIISNFYYPGHIDSPLSQDAAFTHAFAGLGKNPVTAFYLDGAGALAIADRLIQQFAQPDFQQHWPRIRDQSGLAGLQHVAATAGFDGPNWVQQSIIEAPMPRRGLLAAGQPLAGALLQQIPQSANIAAAGSFNLNGLYELVQQLAEELSPDGGAQFHQAIGQVNIMLGLDVQKDLLAAFGTQWAGYVDPATSGEGIMGFTIVNQPANPQQLEQSLDRLENLATIMLHQSMGPRLSLSFRRQTVAGVELNYLASPLVAPAWAIKDGCFYAGLYPQVVASALARPSGAPSIAASAPFQRVQKELGAPDAVDGFAFNDLSRTIPQGYQTLLMMSRLYLGFADMAGGQTPALVLPPLDKIMAQIEPAGSFFWSDADGLHSKSITPFPGAEVIGSGNFGNVGVGESALVVSILLPSLNRARETANRVKCANNLKQIGLTCMLYANDNHGKFPPDLGTLLKTEDISIQVFACPSTTTKPPANLTPDQAADWVNANSDYIYVGAGLTNTAPADAVLAYEKDGDHNGDGMNMLFADGHVEFDTLPAAHSLIEAAKGAHGL